MNRNELLIDLADATTISKNGIELNKNLAGEEGKGSTVSSTATAEEKREGVAVAWEEARWLLLF